MFLVGILIKLLSWDSMPIGQFEADESIVFSKTTSVATWHNPDGITLTCVYAPNACYVRDQASRDDFI